MPNVERRKDLRVEAEVLPLDVDGLNELRLQALDAGYPAPQVHGLCGWLVSKNAGDPDVTSSATRSRYRQMLTEILDVQPDPLSEKAAAAGRRGGAAARGGRGAGRVRSAALALVMATGGLLGVSQADAGATAKTAPPAPVEQRVPSASTALHNEDYRRSATGRSSRPAKGPHAATRSATARSTSARLRASARSTSRSSSAVARTYWASASSSSAAWRTTTSPSARPWPAASCRARYAAWRHAGRQNCFGRPGPGRSAIGARHHRHPGPLAFFVT